MDCSHYTCWIMCYLQPAVSNFQHTIYSLWLSICPLLIVVAAQQTIHCVFWLPANELRGLRGQ